MHIYIKNTSWLMCIQSISDYYLNFGDNIIFRKKIYLVRMLKCLNGQGLVLGRDFSMNQISAYPS